MASLNPMFSYFGSKWALAPHYPKPQYDTIIEPFAGAANYSIRYPNRRVLLFDKDPVIVGVWSYLIRADPTRIRCLPDIGPDQTVDDHPLCQEEKWLVGFWLGPASASPKRRPTSWLKSGVAPTAVWGRFVRARIAQQIPRIRHWKVKQCSYENVPDLKGTWFIDPPYQEKGIFYRYSARDINYKHLGKWCRNRHGQVIVCENEGAQWLPFKLWRVGPSQKRARGGGANQSREVVYYRTDRKEGLWLP